MIWVKSSTLGDGTSFSIRVHHVNYNRRNLHVSEVLLTEELLGQLVVSPEFTLLECQLRKLEGMHEIGLSPSGTEAQPLEKADRKEKNWAQNSIFISLKNTANIVLAIESVSDPNVCVSGVTGDSTKQWPSRLQRATISFP